jgi:hypothetical protein
MLNEIFYIFFHVAADAIKVTVFPVQHCFAMKTCFHSFDVS